jgi:uncharacterized YccA/Bax inhibitor family protein
MAATNLQKTVKENSKSANLLPVLICGVALPVSIIMWTGNLAFSFFTGGANAIHHEGKNVFIYFSYFDCGTFTVSCALCNLCNTIMKTVFYSRSYEGN